MKKRLITAGVCAVFAAVAVVLILSQTVFSGRGKIDVADIEEDSLTIWLMAEEGNGLRKTFSESVQKECPQLTINVKIIEPYRYDSMVQAAIKENDLPDIFCTDSVQEQDYCEDLSDLLRTMDLSSYLHLEELGKEKAVYELPTAVQIGVVYFSEEKMQGPPETAELGMLEGKNWEWRYGDEEKTYTEFQDKDNGVLAIAGDLSDMDRVKEVTVDQVPPTDFSVAPVLQEGRLMGTLENHYGVSKDATPNQKKAAKFVLSLLLSDGVQSAMYMEHEDGIPLNRSVFQTYQENKMTTYLAFLKGYDLEEAVFYEGDGMCSVLKEQIEGNAT